MNAIVLVGMVIIAISLIFCWVLYDTAKAEIGKSSQEFGGSPALIFIMYIICTFIFIDAAAIYVMLRLRH